MVEDVTAILLAAPDGSLVDDLLDALAAQTQPPGRLLVCGLDPAGGEAERVREHPLIRIARVPVVFRTPEGGAGPTRLAAVEDARAALPVHPGHWLWFLADDSRPEPEALAALATAARRSSRVGVVGPKLVHHDAPRLLRLLGHHLTVGGRAADDRDGALVDQGQLDLRQDVLGVPLAGALVDSELLDVVDGLDPAFAEDGVDGLDLSWRAHLVGRRVVVAPDALVRQDGAGLGVVDPLRTRARQRQLALARGSAWAAPFRALGIVLTSLLAALVLLLVKRPTDARTEWADVRAVLDGSRVRGARRRFRGRRTVRPRDLRTLFAPRSTGWRATLDLVGEALDPRDRSRVGTDRSRTARAGAVETGPVSEEFADPGETRRVRGRWSWPLAVALLASAVLTGWQWRSLLPSLRPGAAGVVGPELGAAETTAGGLWRSALDGWRGGGLGHSEPAEAWLLPASLLTRGVELGGAGTATAGVTLAWLLALAVPASVLTAYLALRRATRRRWPRAVLALVWAGLAPLGAAVADGRVGPVVVHVLAPLLVAGYAVCATVQGGVRRTAAAFGTVLAVAASALWVPAVLLPTTFGGLVLLAAGRGSARWRGGVLALLPWLLLLSWLPAAVADPVRVLGGAGATVGSLVHPVPTPPWQLLLLNPGPVLEAGSWPGLLLWLAVPLWLGALGALLLRGAAGRRAGFLLGAALLTLALALLAPRVGLGVLPAGHAEAGQTVTTWPGVLLSLTGAALLLATGLLVEHLFAEEAVRRPGRKWGPVGAALVGVFAVVGLGSLGLHTLGTGTGADGNVGLRVTAAEPVLPAVAADQARSPTALRTLVLDPEAQGQSPGEGSPYRLTADLVGAEPEPARILRDRAGDLARDVDRTPRLLDTVAAITGQDIPAAAAAGLADLGVGFVHARAGDDHPLVPVVDRVPGLARVSSPAGEVLWRLADQQAGRFRVLGPDGEVRDRLRVTGPHAAAEGPLTDVPEGSLLAVAEGTGWSEEASVLVDGELLAFAADGTADLPAGSQDVAITLRTPALAWHLIAFVLAAGTAFLALPFGRSETGEEER